MNKLLVATATLLTLPQLYAAKPNVIYILADDMGYGDIKALNPKSHISTPHLDSMVSNGMKFTDAHTSSSVCTPSRYSIITGRYAWRTTLKRGVIKGYAPHMINPDRMTIADVFKKAGYTTACIGKWHMGMDMELDQNWQPQVPPKPGKKKKTRNKPKKWIGAKWDAPIKNGPNANGFDYYYGTSASLDMAPYVYIENDRFTEEPTTIKGFNRTGAATERFEAVDVLDHYTEKTVSYIESYKSDKPFFIYMPLTAPHTPIVPSKHFKGQSSIGAYGDFCMEVDDTVGRVMKALEKNGIVNTTMVIFTADNGCSKAAKKAGKVNLTPMTPSSPDHHSSYIYRGSKADIWEGGHRVPYIIQWPDHILPGSQNDSTICLTDFLATSAEMAGVNVPVNAGEDSLSYFSTLAQGQHNTSTRSAIVHHSVDGLFAIRQGKWKLNLCPGSGGWTAPGDKEARKQGLPEIQLYDLVSDPSESNNLQAEFPEVVSLLKATLTDYIKSGSSVAGKKGANDTELWDQGLQWIK